MTNLTTGLNMVSLALIHAFSADNVSRVGNPFADDKDKKVLAGALIDGWDEVLGLIGVYKLSKEQGLQGAMEREAVLAELTEAVEDFDVTYEGKKVTVSASDILRSWKEMFCNAKGKVKVPTYGQVFGFRRKALLPEVNAVRRKLDLDPIEELPCRVRSYACDMDRFADCIKENTHKNFGTRALSNVDRVNAAQKLFFEGSTQSHMRKIFKDGMGQKLHALCALDNAHQSLKVVERIVKGELLFGGLDKEDMRKLLNEGAEAPLVDEYLKNPKKKKNADKMAAKTKIATAASQFPVKLVARVCKAIIEDKMESLNDLIPRRELINDAVEAALKAELKPEKVEAEKVEATK